MITTAVTSQAVLILTAAVLFYVALTDLKHFTIRNELILLLMVLFFLHAVLSGRWTTLHWNLRICGGVVSDYAFLLFNENDGRRRCKALNGSISVGGPLLCHALRVVSLPVCVRSHHIGETQVS